MPDRPADGTPPTAGGDDRPRPAGSGATRRWAAHGRELVRTRRLSPAAFRYVTGLSMWALAFIIVSGALVRLTGSGLGCRDWPTCTGPQVVAPWQFHPWIEFGNRLVTGLVSVAVVLAVLGALRRSPRRRDLTLLSLGLVAGIVAEIVLGGITVRHRLAPQYVTAHFLLAVMFLADAVVLHHRAGLPDGPCPGTGRRPRPTGPVVPLVAWWIRAVAWLVVAAAVVVVVLGTVVTSTGPHGGDPAAPRYHLSLHDVAQAHGSAAEVLVGLVVLSLWAVATRRCPRQVRRRAEVLLAVTVAQGVIGYTQYFGGDPAALVAFHVIGAVGVVVAALHHALGLTARPQSLGTGHVAHAGPGVAAAGAAAGPEVAAAGPGVAAEVPTASPAPV